MDDIIKPFKVALSYSMMLVLKELRSTIGLADIGAVAGISASGMSKMALGNSTVANALAVASVLRMGYHLDITNGVLSYSVEPLGGVVARCLAPNFKLNRRKGKYVS